MTEFKEKYDPILKEIEKYNFSNVSKLPGYTDNKWNLIKTVI